MQKFLKINLPLLLILMVLLGTHNSCKESGETSTKYKPAINEYAWVNQIIDTSMTNNNIPSLSIGIIENGQLVYARGFGTISRDSDKKVDENTIYQIGSDTKKMTGIIAKNLEKEGKLSLSEPITKYLLEKIPDSTIVKLKAVTLEYLLTHKAGIPYRTLSNKRVDGEAMLEPYTERNLLNDLNSLELEFAPGTDFGYSNFDFAIAGYICELASGMSYADLIQKYISEPYAMPNTTLSLNEKQMGLLATPYRKDNREIATSPWNMGKLAPAGGVYSSVTEIAKLMLHQMEAYKKFYQTKDVDSPLILTQDNKEEGGHYGMGLGKSVDDNGIRYGHGGDLDGYASTYVFSTQKNVGLILFTSSGGKWFGKMSSTIFQELGK